MRRVIGSALVALFALSIGSASGRDDKKVSLVGNYTVVGIEFGGMDIIKLIPESDRVLKVTADKMVMTKNGKDDPATYKLDTSKTPYQIDLTGKSGDKEAKMYGIFKVEGDKLIICISDSADNRPKEFKTPKLDPKTVKGKPAMVMLMTLEKKK